MWRSLASVQARGAGVRIRGAGLLLRLLTISRHCSLFLIAMCPRCAPAVRRYHAPMEYQALTVRLDKDVYERLRRVAFEARRSMASIIGEAVAEKLDREGPKGAA